MGQSRGGYGRVRAQSKQQIKLGNQIQSMAGQQFEQGGLAQNPAYQQILKSILDMLPGGQGQAPITAEANRNFQQNTIPSILNAFGTDNKGSSALNQAIAGAGANLNSSLAAQQAQNTLQAGSLGLNVANQPFQNAFNLANLGLGQQQSALTPKATPFWQDALIAGIQAAGHAAGSAGGG